MPIYAYRCGACGHAQDVLQKMSDPLLTTCPACGAEAYTKQLTAAGFQLKGSGWYVTDFRDGNKGGKAAKDAAPAEGGDKPADAGNDKAADKPAAGTAAPAAPAATPAAAASPAPATAKPAPPAAGA